MGILKHFFSSDVDPRVKFWVYITRPLNCLLWGCKYWNVTEKMKKNSEVSITQPSEEFWESPGVK